MSSTENNSIPVHQQIISSATGALIVSLSLTPLDVIRIRLQSQINPISKGDCFLYSNGLIDHLCTSCSEPIPSTKCEWFNRPGQFNGTFDALVKIVRREGVTSLWSGLSPTIATAIPATVFYFTAYDNLSQQLRKKMKKNEWAAPTIAGTFVRGFGVFFVSPLEMIRTKMQSEVLSFKQIGKAIQKSVKQDGVISMWRGVRSTLLRDIPFSGIYWTLYELLKAEIVSKTGRNKTSFKISLICGMISGSVAAIATNPFDVIKTRQQITLGQIQRGSIGSVPIRRTLSATFNDIVQKNGIRGLYAGLAPRLVKIAPACGIMIGSYEALKIWFKKHNEN